MSHLRDPNSLTVDEIQDIEKQSLRSLYTAACDFSFDAYDIFYQSNDDPKDIAEDTTREILDRLGGYQVQQRILGNVDYRKARYIISPEFSVRQALFVDSKAEKSSNSATLQMSQLSIKVYQNRGGEAHAIPGKISSISTHGGHEYITTTLLVHYHYDIASGKHNLKKLTLAAIPNGRLQTIYNPNAGDTIWIVGRNAPSRGEDFRVRLSFKRLLMKARWRVQNVIYDKNSQTINSNWNG